MIIEKDYVYEVETEVSDLNEENMLKPYGYQRLINKVIEKHLNRLNFNVAMTMKHNLAWVLVSLTLELAKPVSGTCKLTARTWHSERRGPFFRRDFQFMDENDKLIFQGSSFSVLLDVPRRAVYRQRELPFELMAAGGEATIEARPSLKTNLEFVEMAVRDVQNSHIDCLGHVNNVRYGEFAYDTFTENEKGNLKNLRRIELYFAKELRPGDRFAVLKARGDDSFMVRCNKNDSSEANFTAVYYHWNQPGN